MFSIAFQGSARDMADVHEAAGLKGKESRTKGREVRQPPNALLLGNCQPWESSVSKSVTNQYVGQRDSCERKLYGM